MSDQIEEGNETQDTRISEGERKLLELSQQVTAMEGELGELRMLKMKIDAARELGRPDLIKMVDTLPNVGDKEALKAVMSNFASFADEAVREREKELLAGITPALAGGQGGTTGPKSEGEWMRAIEEKPLGSPERQRLWDDYWRFLEKKNAPK